MRSSRFSRSVLVLGTVLLASFGCGDATGPTDEVSARAAAGIYVLEPAPRGPSSGSFVLTSDGQATRRVRYVAAGSGTATEFVAKGTFRLLANGTIEFALREDDGASPYVWQPKGARSGIRISIRYGDPLDGPDIVEQYRRE